MKKIFIFLVKAYQIAISPFIPNSCRFTPTCSEYAILAIKKYNIFKATFLIIKRLLKCHPYHKGGHDPLK